MKCVCNNPLLLTPDGASVSSYSVKPFIDFDSFLSCSRLTLLAVGSGRAPFCFLVLPCAVAVLEPSIQGLFLFPAALVKIRQPGDFFLNFALDFVCALRNVSSISLYTTAHFHKTCKVQWGFQL